MEDLNNVKVINQKVNSVEGSSTSKKRKKHPFVKTIIILVLLVGFILYNWNIAGIRHKVWVQEAKWYVKIHQKDLESFIKENADSYEPEGKAKSIALPKYRNLRADKYITQEDENIYVIGFLFKAWGLSVSGDYCDIYYSPDDILCGINGFGKIKRNIDFDFQFTYDMQNYIYRICENWYVIFAHDS